MSVRPSATVRAIQMPLRPKSKGRSRMAAICRTSVRRNEMAADKMPLLRAVKKAEPKILKPATKKDSAYSRKA